jgi:KaiC/GvpD/RAD55 family RecA-like ATPase
MAVVVDWRPGEHYLLPFRDPEEHRATLAAVLMQGLQRDERIVYIAERLPPAEVVPYLSAAGVPAGDAVARGQFIVRDARGAYGPDDVHTAAVLAYWSDEVDRALENGYRGLRAAGDMTWALGNGARADRLCEYEMFLQ